MAYKDVVNTFSTTRVGVWLARTLASRLDPLLYRWSKGRFTSVGKPSIPQLVLTTTGRRSGEPRTVIIGYMQDGDSFVVVGSNFGQEHDPAWALNLDADPSATVEVDDRTVPVTAAKLDDDEKAAVWDRLVETVPQFAVYVTRTDRNIKVFRLNPVEDS